VPPYSDIRGGVTAFEEFIARGREDIVDELEVIGLSGTTRCPDMSLSNEDPFEIDCGGIVGSPALDENANIKIVRTAEGGQWRCEVENVADKFTPDGCFADDDDGDG
jgi:hypothetical protein